MTLRPLLSTLTALLLTGSLGGTALAGQRVCPRFDEKEIIDAAIASYVSLGIQTREAIKRGSCNLAGWEPRRTLRRHYPVSDGG